SGSSTLKDAVEYATSNGVFLVAAAGNSGPCTDCVGYPAKYSEVMAVSATDSNDDLADFSSTGPEVEIAAPGVDILSTVPAGYKKYSGTSMSCPHVAGTAGKLMAN
ncbi:MAG: S8 family serine peptidase, partial [Halobaculum sp.]